MEIPPDRQDSDRVITLRRIALSLLVALIAALAPASPGTAATPSLQSWIVTFSAPPTGADLAVLRGVSDAVHGFTAVPAAVVVAPAAAGPLLRGLPGVRGVWANETYAPLLSSATTSSGARQVWDELGWTGAGVTVAVIDAGVDGTHPDLCADPVFCKGTDVKVVQNVKVVGRQDVAVDPVVYLEDQLNTDTSSGHGSHVAGIVGGFGTASETPGKYRGVAHGASIVGYGTGELVEAVNVLAAYDHAIAHSDEYGIRVINNSWGPGAFTDYDPEHPVNLATDAAWAAGISVVFGAGNDGTRTDSLNMFSSHPRAISAGGGRKDRQQAFFSSKGVPGSEHWHPTVTAPGEAIVSVRASTGTTMAAAEAGGVGSADAPSTADLPFYATSSGTSMASPHVAGVIALAQEAFQATHGRWLSPLEVRNLLQNTARPMPGYQHYSVGAGYVDAYAAVQAAVAGTGTQPYDDGTTYDVQPFAGTVGPAAIVSTSTFSSSFEVAPGATSLDVMADWGVEKVLAANQDLDIALYRPDGSLFRSTFMACDPAQQPNGYSSYCTSAPNERLSVVEPASGTWRVEVLGGLANTSETVRGLWSAAYPDAVAPARAPAAATVSLTAATPASLAGQSVLLTATVRDSAGLPVPNAPVSWSSSGPGTIGSAELLTDANGRAVAGARSGAPGVQTATATSGGLAASAAVTWLGVELPALTCLIGCLSPAPSSTPGKVSGGGWFNQGSKRRIAVTAEKSGSAAPAGELSYDDRAGTVVEGAGVDSLVVDGGRATVTGAATVNGESGYRFSLEVVDNGEPGTSDTAQLTVTKPGTSWRHEASGTLGGGNLQVRAG